MNPPSDNDRPETKGDWLGFSGAVAPAGKPVPVPRPPRLRTRIGLGILHSARSIVTEWRRNIWPLLGMGLLLAILLALLIWPIALSIVEGFYRDGTFSLQWLASTMGDKLYVRQLLNGLLLAACTTLLATIIALPPAFLRGRCRFRGAGVLSLLMLVPMILPPFVGAFSMRHLFSRFGAMNVLLRDIGILDDFSRSLPPDWLAMGLPIVALLQALHLFPILYLNTSAALANMDPAYAQAARNLGAGPLRTFWKITLPLIRPGLFAGGTIVFIWSFTDIGTPVVLGYDQLAPVTIFKDLAKGTTTPTVFCLVFVLLSSSVTLYALGKFIFGRELLADSTKASIAAELRPLGVLGTLGTWLVFGAVILLALLPHIGVVLTAFSDQWVNTVLPTKYTLTHIWFALIRPETIRSVTNSVYYAGGSTVLDLVLGALAAWLIVRSRLRGRSLLDGLVMLPLAVPGLIIAAGYVAMTATGWLKPIGPAGEYTFVILIIAYTIRRLPFAVRGISAGLQQVPPSLAEAARNLGATHVQSAFKITLPLIMANVIAAGVLTFAFAMLEVSDSLILAQVPRSYPITKEIYSQAVSGNTDAYNIGSAIGVYAMIFLGSTMALASALLGKRLGAIFRA